MPHKTLRGTTLTIDESEGTISWAQLEEFFGAGYPNFRKWMYGQTCTQNGAFAWDVDQYIRGDREDID